MKNRRIVSHYDSNGKLLYQEETIKEERDLYTVLIAEDGIPHMVKIGKEEITNIHESKYKYDF